MEVAACASNIQRADALRFGRNLVLFRCRAASSRAGTRYGEAMPNPPKLTAEQRQAALEKAAAARQVRSDVKNRLKMGTITLQELIERADNDEIVAKIKVLNVLQSLPGVGKVTARRTMEDLGIAESRRLSGLGPQQRKSLLEVFS